jgi:predicted glycosyltransferase
VRIWVDVTNSPHVVAMRPLIAAYADLVVSAGGTMDREAVALGTPVHATFEGRLGAVDEALPREGWLRRIDDPREIVVERRRPQGGLRIRRDPRELVKLLLFAIDS